MEKLLLLTLTLSISFLSFSSVCAQKLVIVPDANLMQALLANKEINKNGDKKITFKEALAFTGELDISNKNISSLEGLGRFHNITGLLAQNNNLTEVKLINWNLVEINLDNNQLQKLELPQSGQVIKKLSFNNNKVKKLYYTSDIQELSCDNNKLDTLHIRSCSKSLSIRNNPLKFLQINSFANIQSIDFSMCTGISSRDVKDILSQGLLLSHINVSGTSISSILDFEHHTNLKYLNIDSCESVFKVKLPTNACDQLQISAENTPSLFCIEVDSDCAKTLKANSKAADKVIVDLYCY
jgi:hypothetical protein